MRIRDQIMVTCHRPTQERSGSRPAGGEREEGANYHNLKSRFRTPDVVAGTNGKRDVDFLGCQN